MGKERLDILLHRNGLCDSRELAKRLILAGEVRVTGVEGNLKPGLKVEEDAEIILKSKPRYVSRGGLKLEKALDEFSIEVEGLIVLDAGA
ncbi:MAG: S4 domain-containing protein, partial [Verrucomicrobiota bacterium]